MLTEKENYLMCLRGECPEWVPTYTIVPMPGKVTPSALFEPSPISGYRAAGGLDIWGVNYVGTAETGGAILPEPGNFILEDIRNWRDVIKAPDLSHVDWEQVAKDDIKKFGVDRNKTAVAFGLHNGYFQALMSFMGFTNGLIALYEEPEECKALLEYLSDFYLDIAEKAIDFYQPDVYTMMDDTAAAAAPFISLDMFREFFLPLYKKQIKFGLDRGLPVTFHNCGKCEMFMEDLFEIGVTMWEPAQPMNDLVAHKKKYGNKFVIAGGWQAQGRLLADDVTDEEIYESVRNVIETLAPGGGYCYGGSYLGPRTDPEIIRKNAVITRAVNEIGRNFYK